MSLRQFLEVFQAFPDISIFENGNLMVARHGKLLTTAQTIAFPTIFRDEKRLNQICIELYLRLAT